MKKFINYLMGSFVIGAILSIVIAQIFKAAMYVVPAIFIAVPSIGIINYYFKKSNIRLVRNKFINGAINRFKKAILINSGFWLAIMIGCLFNIDLLLHYVAEILKFGIITFIVTNIVWATIRFVLMRVNRTNNVPNYLQLWNLGY